ncbi:flavonol sulfotransferase-like [Coffea arabica]|uniref:Flavonol sulfotransferase-like n=1 Tax=Coffea arabica TaxID=13443 RepID=A0A6P6UAX0_COFAR|nr:flavonol sulfotransferase-like [Coffea arabica]
MEIDLARDPSYRTSQLPLLATRMPYTSLPKSILKSGGGHIQVNRPSPWRRKWAVLASIKAGLFLKHEVLKKDELFYVKKMAEFMGKPFSKEEEIEGVPEKFIGMCFKNLSNLEERSYWGLEEFFERGYENDDRSNYRTKAAVYSLQASHFDSCSE